MTDYLSRSESVNADAKFFTLTMKVISSLRSAAPIIAETCLTAVVCTIVAIFRPPSTFGFPKLASSRETAQRTK